MVTEQRPVLVHRIGVRDKFGRSGSAAELLRQFGLCAENIAAEIRTLDCMK